MLFHLSDTLIGYTAEQKHKVLIGVTNLLVGYYEGKNLLTISDDFYEHFSKVLMDDRALRALRHLYSYTTYDYGVNHSFIVILDGDCGKNELLIDYFYNTSTVQPVQIIGENTNDIEYYAIVTRIIRHVDAEYLSYNPVLGGGYTTAGRLEKCQNNKELALCIVDSDIKYPKATKGPTYSEILDKYDPSNKHVVLIGIKVHEIENLLPPKYIEKQANSDAKSLMKKIISKSRLDFLRWYDLKSGISVEDLKNADYNDFAKEMYHVLFNSKSGSFERHVIHCARNKKKIFPGVCNNLVKKFLNLPYEKQIVFNIHFKDEWKEIANYFYSFACSRESTPINI